MTEPSAEEVDAFASLVKRARTASSNRGLAEDLAARPDHGVAMLQALMQQPSAQVRWWSANTARRELRRDAVPLLVELARSKRVGDREAALQQLEAIDLELVRPFIPELRRMVRGDKHLTGPGKAAMWRLARLGDGDSAGLFRSVAAKFDDGWYTHRMPLVLAEYLDDRPSIVRRISTHDHDWMFWVSEAARLLDVPDAEPALAQGSTDLPDADCRAICTEALQGLRRDRAGPHPTWDVT